MDSQYEKSKIFPSEMEHELLHDSSEWFKVSVSNSLRSTGQYLISTRMGDHCYSSTTTSISSQMTQSSNNVSLNLPFTIGKYK